MCFQNKEVYGMVSRLDNSTGITQIASSSGDTTKNKEVQRVAPVPAVKTKTDKNTGSTSNEKEMPIEQAKDMVESMNDFLQSADSNLKFVFHEELNQYYVTIVDSTTDEVIREIPSKKLMDIHAAMREFVGLLIDRKI